MGLLTEKRIHVTKELSNQRIDHLLSKLYPRISRNQWQKRIEEEKVLLNHKKTKPSYQVKEGDEILFYYERKEETPSNTHFTILYEDEYIIAVNKPPHLTVHPSGNYKLNTLNQLLKNYYKNNLTFCHPIHRLDRETSGIILYGKNPEIIKILNQKFKYSSKDEIIKIYDVLVFGKFPFRELMVDGYIGKDFFSKILKKQKFIEKKNWKDWLKNFEYFHNEKLYLYEIHYQNHIYHYKYAKTKIELKKIYQIQHELYDSISLLKVQIFTGRMHQIRATLLALGFPIVGDKMYGLNENYFLKFLENQLSEKDKEILILNRTALHCSYIEIFHPYLNQTLKISCELPDDFYIKSDK